MRRRDIENVVAMLVVVSMGGSGLFLKVQNKWKSCIPIKLDFKPSDGQLECVEIFERIKCQAPYRRGICERFQKVSKSIGNLWIRPATVDSHSQIPLSITEKCEFRRSICRQAYKKFTRA